MFPNPITPSVQVSHSDTLLRRLLGGMFFFTMLMTIPQVVTIWFGHQAAGVSLLSWSAYLASAVLWFWFGIQKGFGSGYKNATRISICHAWAGWS
jgi:uncharacterized protein with PQ loop repeat